MGSTIETFQSTGLEPGDVPTVDRRGPGEEARQCGWEERAFWLP